MSKLIIGLGNPGKKYAKTRHNVGFMAIDYLAKQAKTDFRFHKKSNAEIAETDNLILAKPQTFMNNSGSAVEKLISYFNVADNDVLVVYDDVDLPLATTRFRSEGSSAGHKGMQSIIDVLDTNAIKRIRIGVGKDANTDTDEYVLQPFTNPEAAAIKDVLQEVKQLAFDHLI